MGDDHLGSSIIAKNRVQLFQARAELIYFAQNQAGLKNTKSQT